MRNPLLGYPGLGGGKNMPLSFSLSFYGIDVPYMKHPFQKANNKKLRNPRKIKENKKKQSR